MDSYRQALNELKGTLGENKVFEDPKILYTYSFDASGLFPGKPLCVVRAFSREDVANTLKIAYKYGIPVTVRGSGTSLTGASIPSENSIVLDLSPMNRIIEVNVVDGYVDPPLSALGRLAFHCLPGGQAGYPYLGLVGCLPIG